MGNAYSSTINSAGIKYGVPPALLYNQINAESGFNPNATSSAGAQGIAQFMPATSQSIGLTNPFDPTAAINSAAQYDAQNYKQFGNWYDAMLAYNQGPTATAQGANYPAATAYANKIMSAYNGSTTANNSNGSVSTNAKTATTPMTVFINKNTGPAGNSGTGSNANSSLGGASILGSGAFNGSGTSAGSCPANDTPIFSFMGYPVITPCGLWDLTVGLVGLILIIAGFKSSAPAAMISIAKAVT